MSMAYGRREPSIFDGFTLSPLPYPVLFILLMVLLLVGVPWFFAYEEAVEEAEQEINWLLIASPILLLLLIRWLSSVDSFDGLFGLFYPYDRRQQSYYYGGQPPSDGGSPWGVAAVVVLVLILVSMQSSFQDMWGA